MFRKAFLTFALFLTSEVYAQYPAPVRPDDELTPGALCTIDDPDFSEFRYEEQIPYCARQVSTYRKRLVYAIYEVPEDEHINYTIDHLVPLSLGGSNDISNLWPEPKVVRQERNVENTIYVQLRNGELTQNTAVRKILSIKREFGKN